MIHTRSVAHVCYTEYMPQRSKTEETFRIAGSEVVAKVKKLVEEGNVRKITIRDKENHEIAQFPLTIGVAGLVLAPVLAAIGALVAVLSECSITVEREENNG